MAAEMRKVVTRHAANGKPVVVTDEQLTAVLHAVSESIFGCEMLSALRMPAANSASGDAAQREGFVKHSNYVGTAGAPPSGATP